MFKIKNNNKKFLNPKPQKILVLKVTKKILGFKLLNLSLIIFSNFKKLRF